MLINHERALLLHRPKKIEKLTMNEARDRFVALLACVFFDNFPDRVGYRREVLLRARGYKSGFAQNPLRLPAL
jgi:hypothetical protein